MMKLKQYFSTGLIRLTIVLFWIVIIFAVYHFSEYTPTLRTKKTLYIAAWPLSLDAQYLTDFEKKTGITLKISYFESSEELISKVQATEGVGYDIIFPTDYTVDLLISQGLLKRLDKNKLNFWQDIDKRLLHGYYDPGNDYTIPFYWAAYGIGYNSRLYGDNPPKTWGLLYDQQYNPQHVIMTNSAREAILVTAQYLFGSVDALKDPTKQRIVQETLIRQKKWVDLYTEERVDELLASENNMIVFGLSPDITRAQRRNKEIRFMVPDEGSFIVIDSIAIPVHSKNVELAYQFINYLYQPDVVDHHIHLYNMCSPITSNTVQAGYAPADQEFSKLHFLTDIIAESGINKIWINLLAY